MNFKTEFIQICFWCSADFIQPSFHLFFDVVISLSVSINRALTLLFLFFDLHCPWLSYMLVRFKLGSYMLVRFTLRIYMLVRFTLRIYLTV